MIKFIVVASRHEAEQARGGKKGLGCFLHGMESSNFKPLAFVNSEYATAMRGVPSVRGAAAADLYQDSLIRTHRPNRVGRAT